MPTQKAGEEKALLLVSIAKEKFPDTKLSRSPKGLELMNRLTEG